jgi:hypothetical protein
MTRAQRHKAIDVEYAESKRRYIDVARRLLRLSEHAASSAKRALARAFDTPS